MGGWGLADGNRAARTGFIAGTEKTKGIERNGRPFLVADMRDDAAEDHGLSRSSVSMSEIARSAEAI